MLRSTLLSVHRILIAVFIRSASADTSIDHRPSAIGQIAQYTRTFRAEYGDTKTKTDATAIVSSGQLTTDYRLSIRPVSNCRQIFVFALRRYLKR